MLIPVDCVNNFAAILRGNLQSIKVFFLKWGLWSGHMGCIQFQRYLLSSISKLHFWAVSFRWLFKWTLSFWEKYASAFLSLSHESNWISVQFDPSICGYFIFIGIQVVHMRISFLFPYNLWLVTFADFKVIYIVTLVCYYHACRSFPRN